MEQGRLGNWPLPVLSRGALLPLKQASTKSHCAFFRQSSEVAQRLKRPNRVLRIKSVTTAGVGLIKLCWCFWLNVEPQIVKVYKEAVCTPVGGPQRSGTGVREPLV